MKNYLSLFVSGVISLLLALVGPISAATQQGELIVTPVVEDYAYPSDVFTVKFDAAPAALPQGPAPDVFARLPARDYEGPGFVQHRKIGPRDLYAILLATGLDPERSTVFAQSHVTAHAAINRMSEGSLFMGMVVSKRGRPRISRTATHSHASGMGTMSARSASA